MDTHPVDLFSGTIDMLSRSLDLRARNHEMLLNNVANADTPDYQPFSVNVEQSLQRELQSGSTTRLELTNEQHLAGRSTSPDPSAAVESDTGDPLHFRGDGNGVDIDAEMTSLARNTLLYKTSAQIVAAKFKGLKNAITGGNK